MFTQQDAQNIEQLALLIFEHNRTLVDLSNLQNTEQFLTVINLFPKILVPYNSDDYSCEEKIYLIFEQYVNKAVTAIVLGRRVLHDYNAQDMSLLFERLKNIELKIYNCKCIVDVLQYIQDLVEVEKINKIVLQHISRKLLYADSLENDFIAAKTLEVISEELLQKYNGTVQEFNDIGVAESICVNTLCKKHEETCGFLEIKLARYITSEFDSITEELGINCKDKYITDTDKIDVCKCRLLVQKEGLPEFFKTAYIINMFLNYLDVIGLINCCNNKDIYQNAYAIYDKLNIIVNSKFNMHYILPVKEICEYIASKLFDSIETLPAGKKPRKHECLFDGLMFSEHTNMLGDALTVLAFFERYVSIENKSTLLSLKYNIIKKYNASLGFDSNSLQVQPNLKLTMG